MNCKLAFVVWCLGYCSLHAGSWLPQYQTKGKLNPIASLSYISGVAEVSDNYSVCSFLFELIGMVINVIFFKVFYDFPICFWCRAVEFYYIICQAFCKGSRVIALLILDLDARRGWVVSTTPRPLYLRETPGTHCTGGWVGPRAGLDVCEKSSPHRDLIPGPSSP
jgi:hypothetical protein